MTRKVLGAAIAAILGISHAAHADVVLHEFKAGQPARASDVNGNFNNLKNAVEAAQRENNELRGQLKDLKATLASVIALKDALSVESVNGVRTVRLTGVNLQVVNGTNSTELVNGAGNLIVGYDEPNIGTRIVCSLATDANGNSLTNEAKCLGAGGTVAVPQKSGSHNLVMGTQNSYSSAGGIVGGSGNFITAPFASNLGGTGNFASGRFAVNVAGTGNHPSGLTAATLAGANNTASGSNASVSGGSSNTASSVGTTVSGGSSNAASGPQSNVSGGIDNISSGPFSHVSGGGNNNSTGATSTIAGGSTNESRAPTSSVSGGSRNVTTGVTQVLP
ncbi:MAG TPA: hypothetical protein VGO61_21820 [Steroidobacteraceae bacterium]|jgi:hypothetical protein|nr:hypothetical protein [Steroidobacteraceae bacterium]